MATKTVLKLNDLRPSNPFEDIVADVPFAEVSQVADRPIFIEAVKVFENEEKGEGVHILFKTADTKEYMRTCTHSIGIVGLLKTPQILAALEGGDVIECAFEVGTSKTSGRKVYRLKSVE